MAIQEKEVRNFLLSVRAIESEVRSNIGKHTNNNGALFYSGFSLKGGTLTAKKVRNNLLCN